MTKGRTFTITVELTHLEGPKCWPDDEINQALDEALDGTTIYVQDPDRDDETGFDVTVIGVDHPAAVAR